MKLVFILIASLCAGCTNTFVMNHTTGTASDLMDQVDTKEVQATATATIPAL